jgi:LPS sulfotransferase NodH
VCPVCATPRSGSTPLGTSLAATHVEYETFVACHEDTVRRVLHHLRVSAEHIPDPPLSRQGDDRFARCEEVA